jgi:hypothetical protein
VTAAQAAESMRKAAARLRRWATVLLKSSVGDAILHNMIREAERLESDADKLFPRKWKGY